MQNKINFLKRFFEPAIIQKRLTAKMLIESCWAGAWWDLIPLFSMPLIISYINQKDAGKILLASLIFIVVYLFFWYVQYKITHWDFPVAHMYNAEIENLYREKILVKDNYAMDIKGTGEVQSIISKGISNWGTTLLHIIYQIPRILIGFSSGFYFAYKIGAGYLFLFIGLFFISMFGFSYFRNKRLKSEEKINDIEDIKNKNSTRFIMSRVEILFANKINLESNKLKQYNLDQYREDVSSSKHEFASDIFISGVGTILPFVFLLLITATQNFQNIDTGTLIAFVYFSSRWQFTMYSAAWLIRKFLDSYPQVKKFSDFIDQVPAIKNYETGKVFEHKTGEIVLRNVSFSYDAKDAA